MTTNSKIDMPAQTAGTTHSEVTSVEPVISVKNLNIYYDKFLAVRDVTMEIAPRSITALIGPSGCGKSTFLRSLNRMHEVIPKARVDGQVFLNGEGTYGPGVDPVTVRSSR
jgi:phosphate transport system ATP-binding protein